MGSDCTVPDHCLSFTCHKNIRSVCILKNRSNRISSEKKILRSKEITKT